MKKRNSKCMIGIAILILLSLVAIGGCTKKSDKEEKSDKEQTSVDEKDKLQIGEDDEEDEGPSVDFEDVFSNEDEENKSNVNKDNTAQENNKDNNKEEGKQEGNKENNKEDNKEEKPEDTTEGNKDVLDIEEEDKGDKWGPFY